MSGIPLISYSDGTKSGALCQDFMFFICFTDRDINPSGSSKNLLEKMLKQLN
jgi:hypothetical protein